MTTALKPHGGAAAIPGEPGQPADVLVVFGITGDLARVMTFQSLYRLEARGLLDVPIVGVAVQDWTDDELREHARACIEACGETIDPGVWDRFAARLSWLAGDPSGSRLRVGRERRGHRDPLGEWERAPILDAGTSWVIT